MSALPKTELEPRLEVALAAHGGRLQEHLRQFLNGPGREQFVISHAGRAQVLIADHDHQDSRDELHRFLLKGQGPAIVLAVADPSIPDTVWVPKPVQDAALLAASQGVLRRLAARPALRLMPVAAPAPAEQLKPANQSRLPGRPLMGPFRVARREDWTARIACMALGALGIAAVVSSMGWRPAEHGFRPMARLAALTASPEPAQAHLRQAVELARLASPPMTAAQQAAVEAELLEIRQLSTVRRDTVSLAQLTLSSSWGSTWNSTLGSELPDVSRRALPVALMVEAQEPWRGQAALREALAAATQRAPVVALRSP